MFKRFSTLVAAILLVCAFALKVFTQDQDTPIFLSYEQRVAMSYLLLAADKDQAEQDAIAEKLRLKVLALAGSEPVEVKVQSFEEFLRVWRGEWPNTHKLSVDLEIIEGRDDLKIREFVGSTPEVQERIDAYIEGQAEYFKKFLSERGVQNINLESLMGLGLISVADEGRTLSKTMVAEGSKLLKAEMKIIDELGEKIISSGQMSQMNGGLKRVMELAIGDYFKHLSSSSKAQIVNIALGERLDNSDMKKFEILVSGAGPQFQKLLQIMAREKSIAPELLEVFRSLESNVRPVPWVLVRKKIEAEAHNYDLVSVEEKPLGVGTMAQVHKGQMKKVDGSVEGVVVRFLKPDILERVIEDGKILAEMAPKIDADPILLQHKFPPLTPIVDDLTRTVMDEFDLMATMKRQDIASVRYKVRNSGPFRKYGKGFHISVPGVHWPRSEKTDLMVQEMATGKKLDKVAEAYKEQIPDLKRKVVEEISRLWVREVLFGEGFFHADLHQGNFMVEVGTEKVLVNLLDFGMAGVLDKNIREAIFSLAGGMEILKARVIADSFWKMSDQNRNKLSYDEFYLKVDGLVRDMRNGIVPTRSFDQWVTYSLESGLFLPYNVINLNRGFVILNKLLGEVGSEFEVSALAKKQAVRQPQEVLKALWKTKSMSLIDIVKIGWYFMLNKSPIKTDNLRVQAYSSEGISLRGGLRCELLFAK